jgi:hypothetical protein
MLRTNPSRPRRRSRFAPGVNRRARVTRAARFGRSLSLPALSVALCLEQSFSSSSFSVCTLGQPARTGEGRRTTQTILTPEFCFLFSVFRFLFSITSFE